MKLLKNIKQNTIEWIIERMGCITGTRFKQAVGSIQSRITLINELREELRILASNEKIEYNESLQENLAHGRKYEPIALANYQLMNFIDNIEQPGLLQHKKHKFIKYSPDFIEYISESTHEYRKLGEIKCPIDRSIHLAYLWSDNVPAEHEDQVQGGLWVSGLECAVFISYHHDFPTSQQLHVCHIPRDEQRIQLIESACLEIWNHVINNTLPSNSLHSIPNLF